MSAISTPSSVESITRAARRAMVRRQLLNQLGPALLIAMGVAAVVVLVDRLWMNVISPWWIVPSVAGVGALVWAWIGAARSVPTASQAAGVLDDRLALDSRLRSAMELSESNEHDGFTQLAMKDAAKCASDVDPRAALPEQQTRSYWYAGGALIACVAIGMYMPVRNIKPPAPTPVPPVRAMGELENAAAATEEIAQDEDTPDSVREEIEALEELRQELAEGVTNEQEADARTAAQLEQLADALDESADEAQAANDEMSDAIESAQNQNQAEQEPWDPRVEEFADAIREQDYQQASEELDELNDALDSMSPMEREQIAQQLEELANAIEPEELTPPSQDNVQSEQPQQPEQDQPQEPDLSDAIREQADQIRNQEQSEPESSEQQRQEQTEQSQEQGEDQSQDQGNQQEQLDQGEQEQSQDQSQEQGQDQSQEQSQQSQEQGHEQSEQQGQQESPQQNEQRNQGEQPDPQQQGTEQSQEQQSQEPGQQQLQEQSQQTEQQQGQELGQEPNQEPAQDPSQEPGQEQGQDPGQQEQQPQQGEQGQEQEVAQESQDPQGNEQQVQREGDQGEQQVPEQTPQPQPGQNPDQQMPEQSPQPSEALQERLREMQEQQDRARRQGDRAEDLRGQARRLTDPQQQPEDGEGARQRPDETVPPELSETGGDGPRDPNIKPLDPEDSNSEFVPVDGRDQDAEGSGQRIGEWDGPDGEPAPPGTNENTAQRYRRAHDEAQKAIEDQQVPRRHRHLVKEVFKRVQERADKIEGGSKEVAPKAKDAVPTKPESSSDE